MRAFQLCAISACAFLPMVGAAQVNLEFVGKWVVDRERMLEIDPAWDGVLTEKMWIVTGGRRGGKLQIQRGRDDTDTYDPSDGPTTISLDEGEALADAQWEDDRLVVRVTASGDDHAFVRTIYREGQWLVIEDRGRRSVRWVRTYFVKS